MHIYFDTSLVHIHHVFFPNKWAPHTGYKYGKAWLAPTATSYARAQTLASPTPDPEMDTTTSYQYKNNMLIAMTTLFTFEDAVKEMRPTSHAWTATGWFSVRPPLCIPGQLSELHWWEFETGMLAIKFNSLLFTLQNHPIIISAW